MKRVDKIAAIIHRNVCGLLGVEVSPDESWRMCNVAATEIVKEMKAVTKKRMVKRKERELKTRKVFNKLFGGVIQDIKGY